MIELELLGTSSDGESLVLTDAQGERYSVLISDELRGATRRDRPKMDIAPSRPTLAPRDIQALLRAGATPEEIATKHGMDVAAVERFEAPVQAEKDYALSRARAVRIGEGGPTMGDLVLDRLAARGVEPSSLDWSATREAGEPWQIIVTFVQGAAEHAAHWYLSNSGTLEAIDQEAQWLTEQVSSSPASSIFSPMARPAPAPDPDEEDLRTREALVDQLNAARGKRQKVEVDLGDEVDEEAEYLAAIAGDEPDEPAENEPEPSTGPISARIYSLASARTKVEPGTDEDAPASGALVLPTRRQVTGAIPVGVRSTRDGAQTSSHALPWLSDSAPDAEASANSDEHRTPALPMRAVSAGGDQAGADPVSTTTGGVPAVTGGVATTTGAVPTATGSVPAQGPSASRLARNSSSKKGRRSVPSWDEIVFGSKP
nr:septation protein SepH [uncultured Actinomyces sp.]